MFAFVLLFSNDKPAVNSHVLRFSFRTDEADAQERHG